MAIIIIVIAKSYSIRSGIGILTIQTMLLLTIKLFGRHDKNAKDHIAEWIDFGLICKIDGDHPNVLLHNAFLICPISHHIQVFE